MFGFKVRVYFTLQSTVGMLVYHNVTEIHYNCRPGMVAFESDIHGTGIIWPTRDIAEFEATLETKKAAAF